MSSQGWESLDKELHKAFDLYLKNHRQWTSGHQREGGKERRKVDAGKF